MSPAKAPANDERDTAGRFPGAPAWDGHLSTLSPSGLEAHDKGLMEHIANLTVHYGVLNSTPWRARTLEDRRAAGFEKWVARLALVRNERARREHQIGGLGVYLDLFGSPAWDQPWTGES